MFPSFRASVNLLRPERNRESMDDGELIARGRAAGSPAALPARSRAEWRTRSRWLVHLGLLALAAAALGTLQLLHIHNAIHADVGLAFAGLVVIHLAQRGHRIEIG